MASRLAAAAAAAASSSPPLARLVTRRSLADQPWTPHPDNWKVNLWEDPWSPMRWKSNQFMIATVTVWGGSVFGGFMLFDWVMENKKKVPEATTK